MRKLFFVIIFLLFTITGHAQYGGVVQYQGVFASDPPCTRLGQFYFNSGTSRMRVCTATGNPGIWIEQGTGAGTLTGSGTSTQIARFTGASSLGSISGATSDGTSITFSSGNLLATRPKITTSIDDANGNEVIKTPATASAVNEITATNAATGRFTTGAGAAGTSPAVSASGGDTDVDLVLQSQAAGDVFIGSKTAVGATNAHLFVYGVGNRIIRFQNTATASPTSGAIRASYDMNAPSGWRLYFGDGYYGDGDGDGGMDVGLKPVANGVWQVNNVTAGTSAYLTFQTLVVPKATTPYVVVSADANKVFTNEGATALQEFTLPSAAAGLGIYTFVVQDADGIKVTAATGDTVRIAASVSATGGNATSTTIGSTVVFIAINATEWLAISSLGVWVVT